MPAPDWSAPTDLLLDDIAASPSWMIVAFRFEADARTQSRHRLLKCDTELVDIIADRRKTQLLSLLYRQVPSPGGDQPELFHITEVWIARPSETPALSVLIFAALDGRMLSGQTELTRDVGPAPPRLLARATGFSRQLLDHAWL